MADATAEQAPDAEAIRQIAAGEPVTWSKTFQHPVYGELVAQIDDMPKGSDWMRHSNCTDEVITYFGGDPDQASQTTKTLASAIAAFKTLFVPIEVGERRLEDPEDPSHEKIQKVFYEPLDDEDTTIALEVWIEFWAWRMRLLRGGTAALEKPSGETPGSESGE